jgi:hypothetical protein
LGEQGDVEACLVNLVLFARQQIEQQRADAALLQDFGDIGVARAEAAAAATVGEQHHSFGRRRQDQFAIQFGGTCRNKHGAHISPCCKSTYCRLNDTAQLGRFCGFRVRINTQ